MGVRGSATCPARDMASDQLCEIPARSASTAVKVACLEHGTFITSGQLTRCYVSNTPATGTGTGPSGSSRCVGVFCMNGNMAPRSSMSPVIC